MSDLKLKQKIVQDLKKRYPKHNVAICETVGYDKLTGFHYRVYAIHVYGGIEFYKEFQTLEQVANFASLLANTKGNFKEKVRVVIPDNVDDVLRKWGAE